MKLTLLGVTGTVGSALLAQSLASGHEVVALVRNPAKLQSDHDHLRVIEGDAIDPAAVAAAVDGSDAVLSALGGSRGPESLSLGTRTILDAMEGHDVRRLVVLQGFHLVAPGDSRNLGQRLVGLVMRMAYPRIAEHSEHLLEDLQRSSLDWTLVRMPPVSTGKPAGRYETGTLKLGPWNKVRDVDAATYALACLTDRGTYHQAPMIVSR
jgi:putative NADH-flavin reductase